MTFIAFEMKFFFLSYMALYLSKGGVKLTIANCKMETRLSVFCFVIALVAAVMLLIGLCLVAGNGFYIFQIFDDYSVTLPLLFIAFFQCIGVTWIYGSDK